MSEDEARAFERDPLFEEKVQVRKFDESAKQMALEVEQLAAYRDIARANLAKWCAHSEAK